MEKRNTNTNASDDSLFFRVLMIDRSVVFQVDSKSIRVELSAAQYTPFSCFMGYGTDILTKLNPMKAGF